ncbi:MAG TPA: glycosyltransferase family 2 protein [Thermoanaerobaculia bacterium]
MKKTVTIVSGTFNEEANVRTLHEEVRKVMESIEDVEYEHLIIDNASTDNTAAILREIAASDRRVKVILNTRNFGGIRSGYHVLLQARGDAVIPIVADLQDPPSMIPTFLERWREGFKMVIAVKTKSRENPIVFRLRKAYYKFLSRISDVPLIENFSGFGLYDQEVIENLRRLNDPYPYVRGLIADIGFPAARVEYLQQARKRGRSKSNFFTLYDNAMLGLTSYSKLPLRLAAFMGFISGGLSLLVGLFYLVYKLLYWNNFSVGSAPVVVGLFFVGSVQMIFLGVLGEYIGAIYTQVLKRPLVIEKERINF